MEKTPKYMLIMDRIQADIRSGIYAPGDRLPTEREIMREYGVSRIVASSAFANLAAKGVIVRSQGKGSFVAPRQQEQAPVSAPFARAIAVVMPNARTGYTARLSGSLTEQAKQHGYCCAFYFTENRVDEEERVLSFLADGYEGSFRHAGILLFSCSVGVYGPAVRSLSEKGLPTVLIDRNLPGLSLTCVQTDNRLAVRLATRHLLEQGHREILICLSSSGRVSSTFERIEGFIEEMSDHRMLIDPTMIMKNLNQPEPQERLRQLLTERKATAVICLNAATYQIVTGMLQTCGLRVPEDISVITVDSRSGGADDSPQEPTHISQNAEEIAALAVDRLCGRIAGGDDEGSTVLVEPKLVTGGTVRVLTPREASVGSLE